MEELEHDIYPILRSLFHAWTSQAPQDPVQKIWFYIWTVLVFAFGLFMIVVVSGLIKLARTNPDLPKTILSNLTSRLSTSQSLRIGVPVVFRVPLIICIVALLFAAIGTFPYDFYVLLRVAVCFTCAMEFMMFREQRNRAWSIVFLFVALLYNPFIPLHLHRPTWVVINWATIFLFGTVCGLMKPAKTLLPPLTHK